jgi:hypothetical protein
MTTKPAPLPKPTPIKSVRLEIAFDFETGALRVDRPKDPIVSKGLLMEAMRVIDAELNEAGPVGEPSRLWRPV